MKRNSTSQDREQQIADLLNAAGPRLEPDAEMRERVYSATLEAWNDLPEEQVKRPFTGQYWAMAATVLLVGTLFIAGPLYVNESEPVGQVLYTQSDQHLQNPKILEGGVLRTGPGEFVTIELNTGVVLSMAPNSEMAFHNDSLVTLNSGKAYVDAEEGQLRLLTAHLQVVDIGTIYEVRTDDSETEVAMREGRVELAFAGSKVGLKTSDGTGEFIRVSSTGDVRDTGLVETTAPRWAWRQAARAPVLLDGLSVHDYLTWMARDNGVELQFASSTVKQQAELRRLSAAVDANADTFGLHAALETTRFQVYEQQEFLWVLDFKK